MTNHGDDPIIENEPEGGWVTAPPLYDSEITSLILCRFTGVSPLNDGTCPARALRTHKDEDCLTLFISAEALRDGTVPLEMPALETRVPASGTDATYTPLKRTLDRRP